ncbi:MAG: BMC domain-containing protein [Calditrichaceae bacterium]|nr:BMC domain-containing protein [Calditrichaceae bacterium]
MESAYGFIETRGLTAAIEAADAMVKAAKIDIIKYQKTGGALVTILIEGDLAACQSAVAAGSAAAERVGELISAHVIPRPVDEVRNLYGYVITPARSKEEKTTTPVIKKPAEKPPSKNKKKTVVKSSHETGDLLDWLSAQKNGTNINQIAVYLKQDNAVARRIVKQLMDDGLIEKVQQKYFFLTKRKSK